MQFCINDVLYAFSYALDCVEHDLVGVSTHHGLRVACISVLLGKEMGLNEDTLIDLAACAVLHDNALTEYIRAEHKNGFDVLTDPSNLDLKPHCAAGERNLQSFPFPDSMKGSVLYHHEHADGTGIFGKTEEETPLTAQLIHMGDQVDANWNLDCLSDDKFKQLTDYIKGQENKMFSSACVQAFDKACTIEVLRSLGGDKPASVIRTLLHRKLHTFTARESAGFSDLFSAIIDYKSSITGTHSKNVAILCETMGKYYGYSEEEQQMLYFSGAVHDIGKLIIDRDILEKPDKLTNQEFIRMKNHAYYSYKMLSEIEGFEEITKWAAHHHEKLDGSGYPFGKTGEELGKNERLMACLDIYQALREKRPYKEGYSHEKALLMLRKMAANQLIDSKIVEDLDYVFKAK